MGDEKAVVLLSGGLDSTTTLAIALDAGYETYGLIFDYGQRHRREIESAKRVAEHYEIGYSIVRLDYPESASALTDSKRALPERELGAIGIDIPSTYVPARNLLFLSYATAYAESMDASTIFIGANVLDYSGYPDCRPEFLRKFEEIANIGTRLGAERAIKILSPLINLSKNDIIERGLKLSVPYELTWSCYEGGAKACGRCDSCKLRLRGFELVGHRDPIEYE